MPSDGPVADYHPHLRRHGLRNYRSQRNLNDVSFVPGGSNQHVWSVASLHCEQAVRCPLAAELESCERRQATADAQRAKRNPSAETAARQMVYHARKAARTREHSGRWSNHRSRRAAVSARVPYFRGCGDVRAKARARHHAPSSETTTIGTIPAVCKPVRPFDQRPSQQLAAGPARFDRHHRVTPSLVAVTGLRPPQLRVLLGKIWAGLRGTPPATAVTRSSSFIAVEASAPSSIAWRRTPGLG